MMFRASDNRNADTESNVNAAIQVIIGITVTVVICLLFLYTSLPLFSETRYPDGSYPISWRSGLAFLLFLAVGQFVGFCVARRIGRWVTITLKCPGRREDERYRLINN
jgi:hypothetical protein